MKVTEIFLFICLALAIKAGPVAGALCPSCVYTCTATTLCIPPWWEICIAGCCGVSLFSCFSENVTAVTDKGVVLVSELQKGSIVLTSKNNQQIWTQVVAAIKNTTRSDFVRIFTQNQIIQVTLDHVMIIQEKLLQASDIKLGMTLNNEKIIKLELFEAKKRITIITREGTILVNGVLTTTICGDYLEGRSELAVLEDWKRDHEWLMQ